MENLKVVVLGAGTMGSGIAALLVEHGHSVTLLDLAAPPRVDGLSVGTFDQDLGVVADADWVIEAVVEDLEVKRGLYASVITHLRPDAFLTSNTSTILRRALIEGMAEQVALRFGITHFFNPPNVMRLVEVVAEDSAAEWLTGVCASLGKTVIRCRDSPGFIANRIGNFWLGAAYFAAQAENLPYEVADTVMGKPFGIPRTGVFGLLDYVGIQIVPKVWGSLEAALPADDAFHRYSLAQEPVIVRLSQRDLPPRTGFYRSKGQDVLDSDFTYRPRMTSTDPALSEDSALAIMRTDSPAGRFARRTFLDTLTYCCTHATSIARSPADIDSAMRLGYGWRMGPFEFTESLGLSEVASLIDTSERPPLLERALAAGGFNETLPPQ